MFRLRQILTFSVLLLFSMESLANISFDVPSQDYSTHHKISPTKDSIALFSFVSEENENEERDGSKVHGIVIDLAPALYASIANAGDSRFNLSPYKTSIAGRHQQVLKLICRLLI